MDVLLRRTAADPLAVRLTSDYLSGILGHDHARKAKLLPTFEKYLSRNCNVSACARALDIRRQSLVYRLEKIRGITGCDLDNAQQRFALQVALRLRTATTTLETTSGGFDEPAVLR
ncbi:MAG: helix-turn-helix domain-containing protein [Casimicrobiaceae bacterium]